jgi:hypothetical protein
MRHIPTRTSVCILYGFCEGPQIGKGLIATLQATGFDITTNASRADIIIAHSGGCFVLPEQHRARLVLLIGVPHWPGKSMARGIYQKVVSDYALHRHTQMLRQWLLKTSWHGIYFWHMVYNWRMLRAIKRPFHTDADRVVLIRNREDTSCTPDIAQLPALPQQTFLALPGQHDDCWLHPERYAAIINAVYT